MAERARPLAGALAALLVILTAVHLHRGGRDTSDDDAWALLRDARLTDLRGRGRATEVVVLGSSVLRSALPLHDSLQRVVDRSGLKHAGVSRMIRCKGDWELLEEVVWLRDQGVDVVIIESTRLFYQWPDAPAGYELSQDARYFRRLVNDGLGLSVTDPALEEGAASMLRCANRPVANRILLDDDYREKLTRRREESFLGDRAVEPLLAEVTDDLRLIITDTRWRDPRMPLPAAHLAVMDEALERLNAAPNVEVWRCPLTFEAREFQNMDHMNELGRDRYTPWFTARLVQALR